MVRPQLNTMVEEGGNDEEVLLVRDDIISALKSEDSNMHLNCFVVFKLIYTSRNLLE